MTTKAGTTDRSLRTRQREVAKMEKPEDVAVMLRLKANGWGAKRIAAELGCARNTVRRYLRDGAWKPYAGGSRAKLLDDELPWVLDAFEQHGGNAEVVRQELARVHDVEVSLRTVERAVSERRKRLRAEVVATVRFETPPGKQMQADFGERYVVIAGEKTKVHFCVLTLGFSRRVFVQAFRNERQGNWLSCMEAAFRHFGGVPEHMLVDNARALVSSHNVETGEILFSERFAQFATYWGFKTRACAPYRARTKGKDERGVGYVKRNAIAGRTFESWEQLEGWLAQWMREVADVRVHGTTGEQPLARFDRAERKKLLPLDERPPFFAERELERIIHNDACVEVDANWYTVPWKLVGETVTVRVRDRAITITHGDRVVATHTRVDGRRQRVVAAEHWEGLARTPSPVDGPSPATIVVPPVAEFARSLDVYAAFAEAAA